MELFLNSIQNTEFTNEISFSDLARSYQDENTKEFFFNFFT